MVTVSASGSWAGTSRTVGRRHDEGCHGRNRHDGTAAARPASSSGLQPATAAAGVGRPASLTVRKREASRPRRWTLAGWRSIARRAGGHVVQARGCQPPGPLLRALHAAKDGNAHIGRLGAQPLVARHQRHLQPLGVGLAAQALQQHQAGLGGRAAVALRTAHCASQPARRAVVGPAASPPRSPGRYPTWRSNWRRPAAVISAGDLDHVGRGGVVGLSVQRAGLSLDQRAAWRRTDQLGRHGSRVFGHTLSEVRFLRRNRISLTLTARMSG